MDALKESTLAISTVASKSHISCPYSIFQCFQGRILEIPTSSILHNLGSYFLRTSFSRWRKAALKLRFRNAERSAIGFQELITFLQESSYSREQGRLGIGKGTERKKRFNQTQIVAFRSVLFKQQLLTTVVIRHLKWGESEPRHAILLNPCQIWRRTRI
jgi:hypothetical protein